MKRQTTVTLFGLVLVLACGEWLVSPTIAQRDGDDDTPPTRVPPAAFLTGQTQATVTVDGVEVSLEGVVDEGFALVLHNPTARAQVARFEVDCVQVTGSPLRRIPPEPQVIHTERVEAQIAAGGTVRRALEADVAPAAPRGPDDGNADPFPSFTTTSFRLRRADSGEDASPLAVLRWSDTPAAAARPEAG